MAKLTIANLDPALADALATYAIMTGRDWKRKLVQEWGKEDAPEWMQGIKANYGPAWLFNVKL